MIDCAKITPNQNDCRHSVPVLHLIYMGALKMLTRISMSPQHAKRRFVPTPSPRSSGRRFGVILAMVCLALLIPRPSSSECPVDTYSGFINVTGTYVLISSFPFSFPDPDELADFIGTGGCTTSRFGPNPPTNCIANATLISASIVVEFSNVAHNTILNGCTFNCDGGTCRVRGGDALPVELMGFSVEGEDSSGVVEEGPESRGGESLD